MVLSNNLSPDHDAHALDGLQVFYQGVVCRVDPDDGRTEQVAVLLLYGIGTHVGDLLDEPLHVLHRERPVRYGLGIMGTHGDRGTPREEV